MSNVVSKPNEDVDPLDVRLDAIPLAMYDRYIAKAHLARAIAFAEALAATGRFVRNLLKPKLAHPVRRPSTHAG